MGTLLSFHCSCSRAEGVLKTPFRPQDSIKNKKYKKISKLKNLKKLKTTPAKKLTKKHLKS